MQALRFRSISISDLRLGTGDVKTGFLRDFLRHCGSEYLSLVGDVIGGHIHHATIAR